MTDQPDPKAPAPAASGEIRSQVKIHAAWALSEEVWVKERWPYWWMDTARQERESMATGIRANESGVVLTHLEPGTSVVVHADSWASGRLREFMTTTTPLEAKKAKAAGGQAESVPDVTPSAWVWAHRQWMDWARDLLRASRPGQDVEIEDMLASELRSALTKMYALQREARTVDTAEVK